MIISEKLRQELIAAMVDVRELRRTSNPEIYEDVGGNIVHEDNLQDHIEAFVKSLIEQSQS